jgi:dihydrofolate reductase
MRKIVSGLFISLDGVVESPDKWHFPYFNDEMGAAVATQAAEADTLLFGRVTYQEFASYWPDKGSEVPFADHINNTPKLVASRTLGKVEWRHSSLIRGNVVEALNKLKQLPGRNISMIGSGSLVRSLLQDDVLDELRLLVHPIVVGRGQRLFEGEVEKKLKLVDSKTFQTGVVHLIYQRA